MDERTEQIRAKLQTKEGCWVANSGDVWYLLKRLDESSPSSEAREAALRDLNDAAREFAAESSPPTEKRGELEKALRGVWSDIPMYGNQNYADPMAERDGRKVVLDAIAPVVSRLVDAARLAEAEWIYAMWERNKDYDFDTPIKRHLAELRAKPAKTA
jgi:hypothetical protein